MGLIIRDHDELAKRLRGLREGGKTVVFTNGCFDLLHVGHIRCLIDAAKRGDYLVVAINGDRSIRKLKGAGRPLQPEGERAEMIAAFNCVAYVTIFDDETCGPILRKLRPQLVAKGTDYTLATLPERDVLAEIGAQLIVVGDPKDHSTNDLIGRIRGSASASATAKKPAAKPASAKDDAGSAPRKSAPPAPKSAGKPVLRSSVKPSAVAAGKSKPTAPAPSRIAKDAVAKVLAARAAGPVRKGKAATEGHG